ncbi:hypothetical protein HMPREF9545_00104 [Escherichia coli MS 16-3]|nr:hypothetical protein HMPREF9545_00104 [Escherichia coli MS 16-3]
MSKKDYSSHFLVTNITLKSTFIAINCDQSGKFLHILSPHKK